MPLKLKSHGLIKNQRGRSKLKMKVAFEAVWSDIKKIYSVRLEKMPWYATKLTEADLQRWARQMGMSNDDLLEQIAIRLARGFYTRELDFTFCDAVINDMFSTNIGRGCQPNFFWKIFLAFDAGEAYAKDGKGGHKRDEDPSEVYTRPLIAEIIKSMNN
jgi:hypothetical protein